MKKFKPRDDENRIYGMNVCSMVFERRPQDIVCAYLVSERLREFHALAKHLAAHKRPYHVVSEQEMEELCESKHHQGICLFAKVLRPVSVTDFLRSHQSKAPTCILALDSVGNPHNIGAIMRSAAHFGVAGIVLTRPASADSSSAMKAACGGRESLTIIKADSLLEGLLQFKQQGYDLLATSSHASPSHLKHKWAERTVILLGEEEQGLSPELLKLTQSVQIEGTEAVESLNVSVASALLVQEWRRHFPLA